jgi:Na+/H+ antiporter nhaC
LSPAVAGTDIWSHIKAMLPNTIPAYAITIVVYALVSLHYGGDAGEGSLATRELFRQLMMEHFRIGWITLIPAAVVIFMGFRKYSVMGTLCTGIFLAVLLAVVYQGVKLSAVSDILMNGFKAHTGQEAMDKLLSKGGIMSMTWVITMMMLSLAFVGCLEAYGTFRAILAKLNVLIRSRFSLVATAASAVLIVGLVAGEIYTSLVLPGRLMKGKFAEMGYDRAILSRTLEDWGTLVSPLIPWNNGGAFVTATLGLSTFIYAPFALFCWLSPLIGLIYAAFGWFTPKDPRGPQTLADEDMEEIADEVDDYMV